MQNSTCAINLHFRGLISRRAARTPLLNGYRLLFLAAILVLLVTLSIFGVDFAAFFIPFSTFLIAVSFAISKTVTRALESVVFVLSAPFDIGDWVSCIGVADNEPLLVHEINLLSTTFIRINNMQIRVDVSSLCLLKPRTHGPLLHPDSLHFPRDVSVYIKKFAVCFFFAEQRLDDQGH